jgi:excisionase family DNA binding protein
MPPGVDTSKLLLTNEDAAELLSISRATLYRLVWRGELTPVKIGRAVRFPREQLAAFVARLSPPR